MGGCRGKGERDREAGPAGTATLWVMYGDGGGTGPISRICDAPTSVPVMVSVQLTAVLVSVVFAVW